MTHPVTFGRHDATIDAWRGGETDRALAHRVGCSLATLRARFAVLLRGWGCGVGWWDA